MIIKYNLLKNLGSGYTSTSLDAEPFEDITLLNICMNYEAKALENEQKKVQFMEER